MLTSEDLAFFCQRLGLSSQAQAVLASIRSSPPSRRVGSGGKNVHVRYTSQKMGAVIQAESHKNEFAGVYEMEHDPTVLEYFDQPPPITLHYQARNGRAIGVLHTPDYFVIRSDSAGWEEWKTEEDLLQLAEKMPHRYFRGEDGQWHCPPGEGVAEPLGFYYRIRSSAEIPWILLRNLSFLEDYLREDCPAVQEPTKEAVLAHVRDNPGIVLNELLTCVEGLVSDDIYTLLAQEQLYVDVNTVPLSEPERVHVFCDEETARAWAVTLAETELPSGSNTRAVLVQAGTPVVWDGRPWTIVNVGETTTTLLDENSAVIELLNARFKALVLQGKIAGLAVSGKRGSLSEEARERIMKADRNALAEANRRYAIIKPVLEGHRPADTTTPARTIRDWAAKYREATQTLGCGYVGLLSNYHRCGNRLQRHLPLPEEPDLEGRYEYFYERSLGCTGMLKTWLNRALAAALEHNASTLTQQLCEQHAEPLQKLKHMIREIREGEQALQENEADTRDLRAYLKLGNDLTPPRDTPLKAEQAAPEPSSPTQPRKGRASSVGKRAPKRDPVGGEDQRAS